MNSGVLDLKIRRYVKTLEPAGEASALPANAKQKSIAHARMGRNGALIGLIGCERGVPLSCDGQPPAAFASWACRRGPSPSHQSVAPVDRSAGGKVPPPMHPPRPMARAPRAFLIAPSPWLASVSCPRDHSRP